MQKCMRTLSSNSVDSLIEIDYWVDWTPKKKTMALVKIKFPNSRVWWLCISNMAETSLGHYFIGRSVLIKLLMQVKEYCRAVEYQFCCFCFCFFNCGIRCGRGQQDGLGLPELFPPNCLGFILIKVPGQVMVSCYVANLCNQNCCQFWRITASLQPISNLVQMGYIGSK